MIPYSLIKHDPCGSKGGRGGVIKKYFLSASVEGIGKLIWIPPFLKICFSFISLWIYFNTVMIDVNNSANNTKIPLMIIISTTPGIISYHFMMRLHVRRPELKLCEAISNYMKLLNFPKRNAVFRLVFFSCVLCL